MDPEGIREVFYAECGDAPDYRFRPATNLLPFRWRCQESYFHGVHLPLTRPLPKRLDITLQQHVGLHRYDAIVLADIDPVILDADDLHNLLAYVESGGGLMLIAGPHSFSAGQRNWGPLCEALPGVIEMRTPRCTRTRHDPEPVEVVPDVLEVQLGDNHPVTTGLSDGLGSVQLIEPVTAADNAAVLLRAGDMSVALAGQYGHGRVIMICAYPGDEQASLFRTRTWDDFLRQSVSWLMQRDNDLMIRTAEMDAGEMLLGDERLFSLGVSPGARGVVEARAEICRADPGWRSVGREPQYAEPTVEQQAVQDGKLEFAFNPPEAGLWRVRLVVEGDDWTNTRTVEIPVKSAINLRLSSDTGEYAVATGRSLSLHVAADKPVSADLRIVDSDGQEVWQRNGVSLGPLDVKVSNWELGDYELIALTYDDEAHLRFSVVEPLNEIPFSILGTFAGRTEERLRWWYEYFKSRGFNGMVTQLPPFDAGIADGLRSSPFANYLAQRDGMTLWTYPSAGTHVTAKRGNYDAEGAKPTRPCVFSDQYEPTLRRMMEETLAQASATPRMALLGIQDEPHLLRANVCHCSQCQELFRRKHGYDMPIWDEALAAGDRRTSDYFEWIVDYFAEAFRKGYEIWKSLGPGPGLYHILCGIGSGGLSAGNCVAQDLNWAPHCDMIAWDCYNYMYAHYRGCEQLPWNEFHYLAGHFRFLSHRAGKPLGFWMQVTDRDVPVEAWNPLRAPSETLYTAIAAGAKMFQLMQKLPFSNAQNCREEKFDTLAADIAKVNRVAPLLQRAQRPRSRIAMVFGWHDRLYRRPPHRLPEGYHGLGFYGAEQRPFDTLWPYHSAPMNVAEMLTRAFGEVDVIDQRALREGALDDYGGFVLSGVDYMHAADADAVLGFVERGGSLICDHVPGHGLDGRTLTTLEPLFSPAQEPFYRSVTVSRTDFGDGRTLMFSEDLNEIYTAAVEREDLMLRHRIKDTVREFFFAGDLRPRVRSECYDVEASLLLTADTLVLVAVNHAGSLRRSRVLLYRPETQPRFAFDLVTMLPVSLISTHEGVAVDVELGEREGVIVGLYEQIPETLEVTPADAELQRGERFIFDVLLADATGQPVRGDHLVELGVTDPIGKLHRVYGGLRCAANGKLRVDEPLAINARTGIWTIKAFDRFTTRQVCATVRVQ